MDAQQTEHYEAEFKKLDQLRLQHERISAKIDYVESELREHKSTVSRSLADLQLKLDKLHERFDGVSTEVKVMATRISLIAIGSGIGAQVLLRKLGLL